MVHLPALPGSAGQGLAMDEIVRGALEDSESLVHAGFCGVIVENFGDVPFYAQRVPPITVACMARVATMVRERWPELRLGINCLRNDARAALAVARACDADAIRVNVHVGATLGDQGILRGRAALTLRERRALEGQGIRILADLRVKHAAPLVERDPRDEAEELRDRGLADALLVTGTGTGRAADPGLVTAIRERLPEVPILVASGLREANAARWARAVDGAIVGSSIMHGERAGGRIDPERARRLLSAWLASRNSD
jgi:membrane complex biogenesis BtpA family protein